MIKKIFKYLLNQPLIYQRLKKLYNLDNISSSNQIISNCINENNWLFSQKKTGTTLICNTLAFYNSQKLNLNEYNFNYLHKYGVFRELNEKKSHLTFFLDFLKKNSNPLIQSHKFYNCNPKCLIITTRNIMDYCVSMYYWDFKHRVKKQNLSVDQALPYILEEFCDRYENQKKAKKNSKATIIIDYKDLKINKFDTLSKIIKFIYGSVDEKLLNIAIENSSIEKLKTYEKKIGRAAIAEEGTFVFKSFIRSGEVGEGKIFFNSSQVNLIETELKKRNIPIDGSLNSN